MDTKRLRRLMQWLRQAHPVGRTVEVRRSPGPLHELGSARRSSDKYHIWINSALPGLAQEFVLCEEYAHCMAWAAQLVMSAKVDHEVLWATAYAQLRSEYGGEYL